MARFKISKDDTGKNTWMAKGIHPKSGKELIIRGGQKGTLVGKRNPSSEKSFDARHNATGMTPKKYINKLRWDNKAKLGTTITIADELFQRVGSKKAAAKKASTKKASHKRVSAKVQRKKAST